MIKIELTISHSGATNADEERLREAIRQDIVRAVTSIAVRVPMDNGQYFNSLKLEVEGTAQVVGHKHKL